MQQATKTSGPGKAMIVAEHAGLGDRVKERQPYAKVRQEVEAEDTCWRVVRVCWPHSTKAAVAPSIPSARARQSHPKRARVNIISFLFAMAAWCMGVPAASCNMVDSL